MQASPKRVEGRLRLHRRGLTSAAGLLLLSWGCGPSDEAPPSSPGETAAPPPAVAPSGETGVTGGDEAGEEVAGGPVVTPPAASPLRGRILEAVRPAVEADLGQAVTLEVSEIRTDGVWAYVSATPRTPDNEPIDYGSTRYAEDVEEGFFDDWLCALLRLEGGAWTVRALEIGATDAPFVDWPERYGAPRDVVIEGAR